MSLKKFRLPGRNEKSSVSFVTAGLYLRFQRLGIFFYIFRTNVVVGQLYVYYIAQHVYMALCCVYTGMGIYGGRNPLDHKSNTSCYILLVCFGCCVL